MLKTPSEQTETQKWNLQLLIEDLRLWSGLVLMLFLILHLSSIATAIFGESVLDLALYLQSSLWRSEAGSFALYGAFFFHIALSLVRMSMRRSLRMPARELIQILSGVLIPFLLIDHAAGTRGETEFLGVDHLSAATVGNISRHFWQQSLLVVLAWTHGCFGTYQAFRWRKWFKRIKFPVLIGAILLPVLALTGFVVGGREIGVSVAPEDINPQVRERFELFIDIIQWSFRAGLGLSLAVIFLRAYLRYRSGLVTINYIGFGLYRIVKGSSVVQASQAHDIPHPALCGGHARCATCRVLVVSSQERLPPPEAAERKMLRRIDAPANVRLGCQLRPQADLSLQILTLHSHVGTRAEPTDDIYRWGVQREVTAVVVNIRGFDLLSEQLRTADTVLMLNRFHAEMTQIINARGGQIESTSTDGCIALFGLAALLDAGAKDAIEAAQAMLRALEDLDREWADLAGMPLRIGIGVHSGPAIVARLGHKNRSGELGAFGKTISIAVQLEQATKASLADLLISKDAVEASGLNLGALVQRDVNVPGQDAPVIAFAANR